MTEKDKHREELRRSVASRTTKTQSEVSRKGAVLGQGRGTKVKVEPKPIRKKTQPPPPPRSRAKDRYDDRERRAMRAKVKRERKSKAPKDARTYFWYAFPLFIIAIILLISCSSYLFYWQADQDIASWDMLVQGGDYEVQNWQGKFGAPLASFIISEMFGIFGMLVPFILIVIGLKVMRLPNMKLSKTLRCMIVMLLLGSLAMGNFTGRNPNHFGSGLGGELGVYAAEWMQSYMGVEGTSILIVVGILAFLYYANADWVIKFIRRVSGFFSQISEWYNSKAEAKIAQHQLRKAEAEARALELAKSNRQLREQLTNVGGTITNEQVELLREGVIPEDFEEEEKSVHIEEERMSEPAETEALIPIQHRKKYIPRRDDVIELGNGQLAYDAGVDQDGNPLYYYLNVEELRALGRIPEPKSAIVLEEDAEALGKGEDIELIIKPRKTEELVEPKGAEAVIKEDVLSDLEDEPDKEENFVASNDVSCAREEVAGNSPTTTVVKFAPSPDDPNFIVEQTVSEELVDENTINLTGLYDPTLELRNYKKPPVELLIDHSLGVEVTNEELLENKNRIVETLSNFGIEITSIEATAGPTVTLYEIVPAPGIRISKIKNLEEDIALSLAALGIRIIAPMPGKGTVGIEVPNKNKETVSMNSVIRSSRFQDSTYDLPIALGKNIQNETVVMDLARMPHLLVAGATGQGKSVGLNAIITSLLYTKHPAELKFVLIDPKRVELTLYSKVEKHFLAKIPGVEKAIITDTDQVIYTLESLCIEMSMRYDLLEAAKVRNINEYNKKFINRRLNPTKAVGDYSPPNTHRFLPYIVVVIDEFADLIMTAGREIETPIARIAQLARAVGIHLVIATQRPSVNIITGVIRANFPARIAFRVATAVDSRTILDMGGANQLVGRGDMLVSSDNDVVRVQCAFVDTKEIDLITEHIGSQRGYPEAYELPEYVPEGDGARVAVDDPDNRDSLFEEVARYVVTHQIGSASAIQRTFSVGFNRAGRIMDQLEAVGIVSRVEGSKPRDVLVSDLDTLERMMHR